MTAATPRPWKANRVAHGHSYAIDADGCTVALCVKDAGTAAALVEANASMITQCVNAHDAIVDACREMYLFSQGYYEDKPRAAWFTAMMDRARTALVQAGVDRDDLRSAVRAIAEAKP